MLKKIRVDQIRLGMHIKEFCGSWIEHPFWRSGFLLDDENDLKAILATNLEEVWIDCSKGVDVLSNTHTNHASAVKTALITNRSHHKPQLQAGVASTSVAEEMQRAERIRAQAKRVVVSMFQEARMGKAIDTGGAYKLVEEITDSVTRNPSAFIGLVRLKTADDYTYMHSVAVCAMMVALAKQLGLSESQTRSAGIAGLMHDLGKVAMSVDLLNKPGKLTDAEFAIIKTHPTQGHSLLLASGNKDPIVLDVCLHHHEKMDGSGYPEGLKGEEISLFAKMGAVCDIYDATTSNRPYKSGWDPAESLHKMAEWSDGHLDWNVFQAFVKSLGIYPVGSLVRLSSGKLGVVVEQTGKVLTEPRVKIFFCTSSNTRIPPRIVDLSVPGSSEKIVGREDPAKWQFADLNELWSGLTH